MMKKKVTPIISLWYDYLKCSVNFVPLMPLIIVLISLQLFFVYLQKEGHDKCFSLILSNSLYVDYSLVACYVVDG